jgi:predicted secreted hydrolase
LVGWLLLAAFLSPVAAGAADVRPVQLPRDHYAHPGSGIEWWYFTPLVLDSAGTRYSVFFTSFAFIEGPLSRRRVPSRRPAL